MNETYDLSRFASAHRTDYDKALREIRNGKKESHWMWYIFPQLQGLGRSYQANYYGISGLGEAKAFLADPCLGAHLREISEALLGLETGDPGRVFGYPDALKLRSCMTLFSAASDGPSVFDKVLEKYYGGVRDHATDDRLGL